MRFSLAIVATFVVVSSALAGCAGDAADSVDSSSANQTASCVSYETARATYDRAVEAAQAQIQVDYSAAMDEFNAGVETAKREYQAKIDAITHGEHGDHTSAELNAAVSEYNAKVGPNGPLVRAYDERVAEAKARFDASVASALQTYNTTICH